MRETVESMLKDFKQKFPNEELHSAEFSKFVYERYVNLLDKYDILFILRKEGL